MSDEIQRHQHDDSCWEKVLICNDPACHHNFTCWETRKICSYRGLY